MNESQVIELLKKIKYPGFSRDIVSFGIIANATLEESFVKVGLELTAQDPKIPQQLKKEIESLLLEEEDISNVEVEIKNKFEEQKTGNQVNTPNKLEGVKSIIAVASGKGGVGKSTISANLACALSKVLAETADGQPKVGLMDCDVYGPSIPQLMGSWDSPTLVEENIISPVVNYGVKIISMGSLVDEESPIVWRGPMIMKTIQQFTSNVDWGELDVLLIDLPPGTGDAQLSLTQILALDGVIIVTTPQKTAFDVAKRGARMFEKVNVPYLGVVENMSYFVNPQNEERSYPFGQGGGQVVADDLKTNLLAEIPLDEEIRMGGDHGVPIVIADPKHPASQEFLSLAERLVKKD